MMNQAQPSAPPTTQGDGLVRHVCFSGSPQCSACLQCSECREVMAAVVYPQVLTMLGLDPQASIGPFLECLAQATGRLHYLMEHDPNFKGTYQVQVFRMRPNGAPAPATPAEPPPAPPSPAGPPPGPAAAAGLAALPYVPPVEAEPAAPPPVQVQPPAQIARAAPPSEMVRERIKPPPMVRPMSVEEIASGGRVLDGGKPTD